eukprot:TRINITY_DN34779_c0_g1_i1.p2 TRINITY_DN34779_c0_g1~~TRINITY_DN34779_c0_g1_i1.p2  ORF type:complete len:154 (+),score=14.70 TRINITY_DN34779_c0_g1_i1:850-1311(+)
MQDISAEDADKHNEIEIKEAFPENGPGGVCGLLSMIAKVQDFDHLAEFDGQEVVDARADEGGHHRHPGGGRRPEQIAQTECKKQKDEKIQEGGHPEPGEVEFLETIEQKRVVCASKDVISETESQTGVDSKTQPSTLHDRSLSCTCRFRISNQ